MSQAEELVKDLPKEQAEIQAKIRIKKLVKVQESLQRSIECSCDSRLLKYCLNHLENNCTDSFLVVPKYGEGRHGVSAILKKRDDNFIIEICDKAGLGLGEPQEAYLNKSAEQIRPIYRYELKTTKKNINVITKALRIGRKHIQMRDSVNPFSTYNKKYYPLKKLNKHADIQGFATNVGTSQYLQGNCQIKNLDAALRILLGPEMESPLIYRDKLQEPIEYATPKMYDSWRDTFEDLFREKIKSSNFEKNVDSGAVLEFIFYAYEKYLAEKKLIKNMESGEKSNVKKDIRKNETARFQYSLARVFRGEKVDLSDIPIGKNFKTMAALNKQFEKQFGQKSDINQLNPVKTLRDDKARKTSSDLEHTIC
ncbi:MAG: hypothetical protein IC227_00175 [Enterococcus lacertideformus]|uniref:Uncharacterized protein n=1 Tax=Enterococcus lacertideformus TaxID=2771493 RepID=A0A931F7T2_9ENTE|nr:hypothetical protein [Enterococcus lacertideformus]